MKLSLEWLKEYVDLPKDLTVSKLMHDLTMATVEVEGAETLGENLKEVYIAEIESLEPVAGRTNLQLTRCSLGKRGTKSILCGAENIRAGMRVAVALPGATIRPYGEQDPKTVEPIEVAGNRSEGVICASSEIGLESLFPAESRRAVIDLEGIGAPGDLLCDAIGWADIVLEIDNKSLTNRPDLWGHYGMARELSAIYGSPLKPLTEKVARPQRREGAHVLVGKFDAKHCRRFSAVLVKGVADEPAPLWMQSRLARIGQRPINFYADLTNYIMFACGQPCHAYDAQKVSLPLTVRPGREGESVKLLDGNQYPLDPKVLAIVDTQGPVAAAGIMGGAESGITGTTKDVLLEAANFDPVLVRRGAKQLGVRTDASSRFEKAIDTQRVDQALDLFLSLVRKLQPKAEIAGYEDELLQPTEAAEITVTRRFLLDRLGKELTVDEIRRHLESIGFTVSVTGEDFTVRPPSWRATGDVSQRFDLIEEVARLHGYDDFSFVAPQVRIHGRIKNLTYTLERRVRELLAFSCGLQEVVTYPWMKDRFLEAGGWTTDGMLKLAGAPAPDQACLQPSLVPNLLETIAANLRYYPAFRIFEVGTIFPSGEFQSRNDPKEKLPPQEKHVAAAFIGNDADQLFREAKGVLEQLSRAAHIAPFGYQEIPGEEIDRIAPWSDRSGRLALVRQDLRVGTLAVLTNRTKRLAGIRRGQVVLFELNLDALEPLPSRENRYRPVPEFPSVDFDLSLLFANATGWREIAAVAKGSHELIDDVLFVDQYRGEDIPAGKKSVTLRLRLLSRERTLKSEEAAEVTALVARSLKDRCGAEARG